MGCDIHSFAEHRVNGKWERLGDIFPLDKFDREYRKKDFGDEPFPYRSYALFGFLADVRNYSHSEVISQPKGYPSDSEYLNSISKYAYDINPMSGEDIPENERETNLSDLVNDGNYHNASYLTLAELLSFDYEKQFWDRRVTKQTGPNSFNGASLAEEGEGEIVTYRNHLGATYFNHIEILRQYGAPEDVRVVFYFDN